MIYNQKVGLPIYALTGFFVCIDFFRSVNQNEKRRYSLKPLTPGEVARFTVTERAFINVWRVNAVYSYRVHSLVPTP